MVRKYTISCKTFLGVQYRNILYDSCTSHLSLYVPYNVYRGTLLMPMSDNRSKYTKYKRTNLFLLRVWCEDLDPEENRNEDMDERPDRKWHGRVQRTVSGEVHSFEGREALIEVLERMLFKDRPEYINSSPTKKTSSGADLAGGGNTTGNNAD